MTEDNEHLIVLTANDNTQLKVTRKVAGQSVLIKNMLEDVGEQDHAIPLPNVNGEILKKGKLISLDYPMTAQERNRVCVVIEYATHHQDDPPPPTTESARPNLDIDEWDRKYMDVDQELIFEIILAANYLDMKNLLDLGMHRKNLLSISSSGFLEP
jgi:S-phase kinase-associated protein 1